MQGHFVKGYDFCGSYTSSNNTCSYDGTVTPDGSNDTHGTHVTGIIAARGNSAGVAGVLQGGAEILPVKVFFNYGPTTEKALIDAVRWAAGLTVSGVAANQNKAKIINLSLGLNLGASSPALEAAIREAQAAGVLVIAAAGNDGARQIRAPAAYDDVIAVGSVNSAFEKSCFSNAGPELDVVAAGGDGFVGGIGACANASNEAVLSTIPYSSYGTLVGTSQATPLVTGVAALIWAQSPGLSPSQVASRLKDAAYKAPRMDSNSYGAGVVRADAAFGFAEIGDRVSVSASGPSSQVDTATLQEDGGSTTFSLGGLKPGSYTVEADAEKLSGAKSVSLSEGEREELTIRLEP